MGVSHEETTRPVEQDRLRSEAQLSLASTPSVVEPEYRGKGMESRHYLNWLGRQLFLFWRNLFVLSYHPSS